MALHLQGSVGEKGIHAPFDAGQEIGLAVAVEISGPSAGAVDSTGNGGAVALELPGGRKDGLLRRADIAQEVDLARTSEIVDEIDQAIAVPVAGAEGFSPVFLPTDNAIVNGAAVLQ